MILSNPINSFFNSTFAFSSKLVLVVRAFFVALSMVPLFFKDDRRGTTGHGVDLIFIQDY